MNFNSKSFRYLALKADILWMHRFESCLRGYAECPSGLRGHFNINEFCKNQTIKQLNNKTINNAYE